MTTTCSDGDFLLYGSAYRHKTIHVLENDKQLQYVCFNFSECHPFETQTIPRALIQSDRSTDIYITTFYPVLANDPVEICWSLNFL